MCDKIPAPKTIRETKSFAEKRAAILQHAEPIPPILPPTEDGQNSNHSTSKVRETTRLQVVHDYVEALPLPV